MRELKFIQTSDMSPKDVTGWEKANKAVSITADDGGVMEMCIAGQISAGQKIEIQKENSLCITICDSFCEREIAWLLSDRDQIKKLRNFLNDYLEK